MLIYYIIKCVRIYLYARNALKLCYEDPSHGKQYGWQFEFFGTLYSIFVLEDKEDDHADIINKHLKMMNDYITYASLFGIVKLGKYEYLDHDSSTDNYRVLIKYFPIFPINFLRFIGFLLIDISLTILILWIWTLIF